MAYEPALNTTQSIVPNPAEKVKYWLEVAMETAASSHMAIIGFIINQDGTAEPFASGQLSMPPEEFCKFVEILAAGMIDQEQDQEKAKE